MTQLYLVVPPRYLASLAWHLPHLGCQTLFASCKTWTAEKNPQAKSFTGPQRRAPGTSVRTASRQRCWFGLPMRCAVGRGTGSFQAALAPVAQLDRALPSGGRGREFESSRARHFFRTWSPSRAALEFALCSSGSATVVNLWQSGSRDAALHEHHDIFFEDPSRGGTPEHDVASARGTAAPALR